MDTFKILYTDPPWALGPNGRIDRARATIEREVFGDRFELHFGPASDGVYAIGGDEFLAALRGVDGMVIHRCQITEQVLAAAGDRIKVVCRQGVGFDNLGVELLRARGIVGFNIPDYCVDEVTTHTLALLLALERALVTQHRTLAGGTFDVYAGGVPRRLRCHTAGLIGFGRIGRAVAERLRLFYGRVLAFDPFVSADHMSAHGVEKTELKPLLSSADAVLLHCPLARETVGILDASAFALMKPTTFVINAARGQLIDSRALWEALELGRIAGAGLDVFSPEDPHRDPWYARVVRHPNVVVTSHRAYLSRESEISQRRRAAEEVRRVLETGQPPSVGLLT